MDCVLVSRAATTGKVLWNNIKEVATGFQVTDHWKPYETFLPREKHIQSKAETYTVEGYNSLFRHFLARLHKNKML